MPQTPPDRILNRHNRKFTHFHVSEHGLSPQPRITKTQTLPPGVYQLQMDDQRNFFFCPMTTTTDQLLALPDTAGLKVYNEIVKFWEGETRAKFKERGLVYKRGVLLYGKPGTGKTCTIAQLSERIISDGGIVIFNSPPFAIADALNRARQIQPDLRVMVVFEEFDRFCETPEFLSLLDGELQIENVVYVATTNHIQKIPPKIKNRPSRFSTVIEVVAPTAEARRIYLEAKLPRLGATGVAEWVEVSEGMVIDQIKDLIVSVECFGATLKEAAMKIKSFEELCEKDQIDQRNIYQTIANNIGRALRNGQGAEPETSMYATVALKN